MAEQRCLTAARGEGASGTDVVVLRAPRFFPEDVLEADSPAMSLSNAKANELLGRRCALVDVVSAHLLALARSRCLRGSVLTLAAPWPLARQPTDSARRPSSARAAAEDLRRAFPRAEAIYSRYGWRLPERITRVYDSDAAVQALGWRPLVSFASLLCALDVDNDTGSVAEAGPVGNHARAQAMRLLDRNALERGAY